MYKDSFFNVDAPEAKKTLAERSGSEEMIEKYLKSKVILGSQKINEGNSGVIGLVSLEDLPDEVRDQIFSGDEAGQESEQFVTKTLKIFEAGAGEREYKRHQEVSAILEEEKAKDPSASFVKVPRLYLYRQLPVAAQETVLAKKLEDDGIDVSEGKFDVLLMDYIDGDDFGTYILKQAIMHATDEDLLNDQELIEIREEMKKGKVRERFDFQALFTIVSDFLNLKVNNQAADAELSVKTDRENHLILIKFLQDRGFQLQEDKFYSLPRSIKALNKNDLYHRDLHERNIMVDYDQAGEIQDYYLLDFGFTVNLNEDNIENPYLRGGDEIITSDYYISNLYASLTKCKEAARQEASQELLKDNDKIAQRIERDERFSSQLACLRESDSLESLSANLEKLAASLSKNKLDPWEMRCPLVTIIGREKPALAREYIQSQLAAAPLSARNKLLKIESRLEVG